MTDKPTYEELEQKIRELEAHLGPQDREAMETGPDIFPVDFRRLAERSQDAIYHYDLAAKRFRFINKQFRDLYLREGETREQLTTYKIAERIHPDDRESVGQKIRGSLTQKLSGGEVEYRVIMPDATVRWVHDRWNIFRNADGRAVAAEGFIRDLTERKTADFELESSKQNALIGHYIVQDNQFRYVNPVFTRITAYTAEELKGKHPMFLVHGDYQEYVRHNAVGMLKGERNTPYEFCIVDKSGNIKWIMETVTSIQYGGGRAALGYFMDITARRDMKHNLASLGLMIGAVSHSLRGCLTGLDAGMYLIETGFYRDRPARIEEGLDASKLMVDRLKKLVYDVLYYVKERELEKEKVDVCRFANDVAAHVETRMRGANIKLSCDYSPDLGEFEIDPDLLSTALLNILENAMEAIIEETDIKEHEIYVRITPEGDFISFDVSDNGPGMDKDQLKDAFTMFYSSKGKKGTGLGLFITKKVIQQHGGSISVDSEPGQGAHFHIRLPRGAV